MKISLARTISLRVFHNSLNVAGKTRSHARVASEGPRAAMKKTPSLHVGRGPVPRHASVEETVLAGVRFSRRASTRRGQAPALRLSRPSPFHRRAVGNPVPRHASVEETVLAGVRFSRRSGTRRGQAPALRLSRPSPFHRRACLGRGNGRGVRFSRRASTRGGQAPALREKNGTSP